MYGLPYAPRWSRRKVSATITTTLGRAWSCMCPPALGSPRLDGRPCRLLTQDRRRAPPGEVLRALKAPLVAESPMGPPEHAAPAIQPVRPGRPTEQEQQKPDELAPERLRPPLQETEGVAVPSTKLVDGRHQRRRCPSTLYV